MHRHVTGAVPAATGIVARPRRRLSNVARNSPATVSNHEFTSLEFQCFWAPVESWCNRITCNFSWSCYCCHSLLPLETFMPVWPGVLLCVLAPHPACIRYKVRPARLVGGENGRKFAMHGLLAVKTVESSPCARKTRQIGPFWASRASFVPRMR